MLAAMLFTFAAILFFTFALISLLGARRSLLEERLSGNARGGTGAPEGSVAITVGAIGNRGPLVGRALRHIARRSEGRVDMRGRLQRAGYYRDLAVATYVLARIVLAIGLPLIYLSGGWILGEPRQRLVLISLLLAATGYVLPAFWVVWRTRRRQRALTEGLPDALDLLVVCVEAGLGLNAAIVKVAEELHLVHPELCLEFLLVNSEMRAGVARGQALKNLGERTGVDDIRSFAAMMVQTDRLGTSVARSLRVHADALRTRRRQRAEETAAKTTIKLVFPLVLFILPALFVIILGPGIIKIFAVLGSVGGGQ